MIDPVSKSMTYGGSATAVAGWFTATEICAIIGAAVAVAGLYIQWDHTRQKKRLAEEENSRAKAEHESKMRLLQKELGKYD